MDDILKEEFRAQIENHIFVSVEIANERMNICRKCPFDYYNKLNHTCDACGCNMLKKTKLKTGKCPKKLF